MMGQTPPSSGLLQFTDDGVRINIVPAPCLNEREIALCDCTVPLQEGPGHHSSECALRKAEAAVAVWEQENPLIVKSFDLLLTALTAIARPGKDFGLSADKCRWVAQSALNDLEALRAD